MNKHLFALLIVISALGGCASNAHIYHDQPLVEKVETGMTKDQVQQIGGTPLSVSQRTAVLGTCSDYMLTQAGHRQPYSVSFDEAGKVDHQSFMSCAAWSNAQQKAREPTHNMGGMGGAGY